MKTFVINRKKWGCGNEGGALLIPKTGKMCCLGFCAKSYGIPSDHLKNGSMISLPRFIVSSQQKAKLPWWLLDANSTSDVESLAFINDCSPHDITPEAREEQIAKIFKKHHINVKFVG